MEWTAHNLASSPDPASPGLTKPLRTGFPADGAVENSILLGLVLHPTAFPVGFVLPLVLTGAWPDLGSFHSLLSSP